MPQENQEPTNEIQPGEVLPPSAQPPVVVPPIDYKAIAEQQQRVINDQMAMTRKMEERLASIDARLNAPAPVDPKVASEQFFADPLRMIDEAVKRQLAPLNETRERMEMQRKYDTLKGQMKRDPRFQALNHPAVESALDSLVDEYKTFEPSSVVRDYHTAIGIVAASGGFNTNPAENPSTPPATKEPVVTTPPHLRPSAPPPRAPAPSDKPKLRELTENERHLARLYGMTPEEYLAQQGDSVTSSLEIPTFSPKKGDK